MSLKRTIVLIALLLHSKTNSALAVTINSEQTTTQVFDSDTNINITSGGSVNVGGSDDGIYFDTGDWTIDINADARQGITADNGNAIKSNQNTYRSNISLNSGIISSNHNAISYDLSNSSYLTHTISTALDTSIIAQDTAIYNEGGDYYNYGPVTYEDYGFNINNAGTINAANAIESYDSITYLNNSGTINGNIIVTEGSITNSGTINGNISVAAGAGTVNNTLGITNSGTMVGNVNLGTYTSSSFTLTDGSLTGDITLNHNTQTINLNGGIYNGTINSNAAKIGNVTINSNQTASFNSNGINQLTINSDKTLSLASSTLHTNTINLNGQLNLGSSNKTLSGDLTGGGASTLNIGNGSHSIDGNITINTGDTIAVTLANTGNVGSITSNGVVTIAAGAKIAASIGNSYSYINNGAKFKIISGAEGSSITSVDNENINVNESDTNQAFSILTFTSSVQDNGLYLNASRASAGEVSQNQTHQAVYTTINHVGVNATGAMKQFQQYLDSATSQQQVDAALGSSLPQDTQSIQTTSITTVNNSVRTIQNRLDNIRLASFRSPKITAAPITKTFVATPPSTQSPKFKFNSNRKKAGVLTILEPSHTKQQYHQNNGLSFGDDELNQGIWGQAFGSLGKESSTNQDDGFKSQSLGVAFGYDKKITKDSRLGVAVSYAQSEVKSNNSLKKTDVDTYQVNLYHGKNFGQYFFDSIIGFAWNEYHSNRTILSGNTATANYNGQSYISKFRASTIHDIGSGFNVTPELLLSYVHNTNEGYTERGADSMNLEVEGTSTNFLEARAGIRLGYLTVTKKDMHITPEIRASYGYDFLGQRQTISSNFVGQTATFNSQSADLDRKSLRLGAGIDITNIDDITFSLNYNFEKKDRFQSHSGLVKTQYDF